MYLLQIIFGEFNNRLTNLKYLVVKIMWHAPTKYQEKIKQKFLQLWISLNHFWLDIMQDELQKIEHIQRGSVLFTDVLDFLQMWKDYLDDVDFDGAMTCALLDDQFQ